MIDANNNSSFWSDRNEINTRLSPSVTECVGNTSLSLPPRAAGPREVAEVAEEEAEEADRNPDKASCVCVLKRLVSKER